MHCPSLISNISSDSAKRDGRAAHLPPPKGPARRHILRLGGRMQKQGHGWVLPRSVLGRNTLGNVGLRLSSAPSLLLQPLRRGPGAAGACGPPLQSRLPAPQPPVLNQTGFPIVPSPSCSCHTPGRPVRSQAGARFVWGQRFCPQDGSGQAGRAGPVTRAPGLVWSGLARRKIRPNTSGADLKVRILPSLGHRLPQRPVSQWLKLRKAGDHV